MHRFWRDVILPLLEAADADTVLEIGVAGGTHTRLLASFCSAREARRLTAIDPAPRADAEQLLNDLEGATFHRARSLDVLPDLGPVDVALIDGDHNWHTVFNELRLLETAAIDAARPRPLFVCHDTGWPYGRRDMYYDPESIPAEHRHEWRRAGMREGAAELTPGAGLNAGFANATREGGPRNGVMTAVEDFVSASEGPYEVLVLPVLDGLAVLTPRERLDGNRKLGAVLERLRSAEGLHRLMRLAERDRHRLATQLQAERRRHRHDAQPSGRKRGRTVAAGRPSATDLPPEVLTSVQQGVLRTRYRDRAFLKSPFDAILYMTLVERVRPATVVEVGTKEGGSAIWFADLLSLHGIDGRVITVDLLEPPPIDDPRVRFIRGDALELGEVLPNELMGGLERPLLVIDDSAHLYETCTAVLEFFDPHLRSGEYAVIEDGVVADLPDPAYERYADGPNRAVADFLERHAGEYVIDESLCDHFGFNFTWSPNGWLRKV